MQERCKTFLKQTKNSRLQEKGYTFLKKADWEHLAQVILDTGAVKNLLAVETGEKVIRKAHDVLIFSKDVERRSNRWKDGQPRQVYMRDSNCDCRNCQKGGEHCFECLRKDLHGDYVTVKIIRRP